MFICFDFGWNLTHRRQPDSIITTLKKKWNLCYTFVLFTNPNVCMTCPLQLFDVPLNIESSSILLTFSVGSLHLEECDQKKFWANPGCLFSPIFTITTTLGCIRNSFIWKHCDQGKSHSSLERLDVYQNWNYWNAKIRIWKRQKTVSTNKSPLKKEN